MYYVTPSVTPFDVYMPAYRIYTIDGNHSQSTWKVLDYQTYYANLTEANLKDKVEWKLEYSAKVVRVRIEMRMADYNCR